MRKKLLTVGALTVTWLAIGIALWFAPGCATPTPTPDPVTPPVPQLTVDCGAPSTRAQMVEVTVPLSRCVQAETPVDSCVASLQKTDDFPTGWPLDAIICAGRVRGMIAWRSTAEGTGTPGDAIEAEAWRDWIRKQESANGLRFKY